MITTVIDFDTFLGEDWTQLIWFQHTVYIP